MKNQARSLKFFKMHSLGNDFMVIETINQPLHLTKKLIQQWSDRHRGIGFDQLLILDPSTELEVDFFYRIFNADGSESGQCGNGARCLAQFIQENCLSKKNRFVIKTQTTLMTIQIEADQEITAELAEPIFAPEKIPYHTSKISPPYCEHEIDFYVANVGNPHAVILVEDLDKIDVAAIGKKIAAHSSFPESVNVNFMQIKNQQEILLRVYERGVGETLACGSGAVASACVARKFYQTDEEILVVLPGGKLKVRWHGSGYGVYLKGPVTTVYYGEIS